MVETIWQAVQNSRNFRFVFEIEQTPQHLNTKSKVKKIEIFVFNQQFKYT